jgi:DNA primase
MAAQMLCSGNVPKISLCITSHTDKSDKSVEALAIWEQAGPVNGSIAEIYLRWRGISPPFTPDLRFLQLAYPGGSQLPCLVCAVRGVDGQIIGIQRIWIANDGRGKADVKKPKLSLGSIKGGAIRIGDYDGAEGSLVVCEGPEDGLSLNVMLETPVWASGGASFLPAMQFPSEVHTIVIGADNDPAGRMAAERAAQSFRKGRNAK